MYKNIIFNPYGGLIDLKENEITDAALNEVSMFLSLNGAFYTCEELKTTYIDTLKRQILKNDGAEYSDLITKATIRLLYEQKGVHASAVIIDQTEKFLIVLSATHIKLRPNIKGLLGTLASRNFRLYTLCSGQKEFALFELKFLAVLNYFKGVRGASEIGLTRMDKTLFSYLLATENLLPGECLFVSDRANDIKCAIESSIDCVYVKNPARTEKTKIKPTYEIADGDFAQLLKYAV
jgi:FMN phosphatase YigB (HAD superfamily)